MVNIPGLAPGFVFMPTDEELIKDYLIPKVTNNPLPVDDLIQEHDLYGEQHPWQIFGFSQEKVTETYVFTPLKKTKHDTSRCSRTIGSGGTWKVQTGGNEVKDSEGSTVGTKKNFTYINNANKTRKCDGDKIGRWSMHEYSLENSIYSGFALPGFQDYALCRITNRMDNLPQELGIKANRSLNNNNNIVVDQAPYVEDETYYVSNITRKETGNEASCSFNHTVPLAVASDEPQLPEINNFSNIMELNDYVPRQLTDPVVEITMLQESNIGSSISQPFVVATPPTQPQEEYMDDFFDELGDITVLPNLC